MLTPLLLTFLYKRLRSLKNPHVAWQIIKQTIQHVCWLYFPEEPKHFSFVCPTGLYVPAIFIKVVTARVSSQITILIYDFATCHLIHGCAHKPAELCVLKMFRCFTEISPRPPRFSCLCYNLSRRGKETNCYGEKTRV